MAAADHKSYILDMNVFRWLVHAGAERCGLSGRRLFATHAQLASVRMLKDANRRSDLLKAFEGVLSPDVLEPHGMGESGALTESQF
ncbi:MAG TPA: hypothetical protein VFW00_08605, partial [Rhodocyclaceae bacterium]|nr:hypothetical protein [Rhodocyclaceae bacterium]